MNTSYKILIRKAYKNKDDKYSIKLRLTINRKSRYYSLGYFISEHDIKKLNPFTIKDSVQDAFNINLKISDTEAKVKQILNNFQRYNNPVTFTDFEFQFKDGYSQTNFYDYALRYIEDNPELADETRRTYKSQLTKIEQFCSKNLLTFQEVNSLAFIENYKKYMIETLGNLPNTYHKSLSFIRTIINDAIDHSILNKNVFDRITLKRVPGKRHFLTFEEIELIEKYYNSKKISVKHKNVLRYFLFGCYTGLRYSDIKTLKYKNIKTYKFKSKARHIIELNMHKTQREVSIPITAKAWCLIPTQQEKDKSNDTLIFRVLSNQKTNFYLKEAIGKAKVDNHNSITCHSARHTFATHTLRKGVPIKTVSQILGHTEVKTTEIYAHLIKDALFEELDMAFDL